MLTAASSSPTGRARPEHPPRDIRGGHGHLQRSEQVSADREVTDAHGHTAWSYDENQRSGKGTYQLAFKASQDTCTTGTQVSSFTGTYTDPKGATVGRPQTYTRQP